MLFKIITVVAECLWYSIVEMLTEWENPSKVNCILWISCKKRREEKEHQQQKRQFVIYIWFLSGNSDNLNSAEKVNLFFEHLIY